LIKGEAGIVPGAEEMIRFLVEGNETIIRTTRSIFPIAERAKDRF